GRLGMTGLNFGATRSGVAIEKFACPLVIQIPLFFHAKFERMSFDAAARGTKGMFDVQHFVEEDVFDDVTGHRGTIQPAIHDDLIKRGVETAQLRAPGAGAPAESRTMQTAPEIAAIQTREHRTEIVNHSTRTGFDAAATPAAEPGDAPAGARHENKFTISAQ